MHTSENVLGLEPSATMAVTARATELAAQGRDIIDLSAGEPDFPTPEFISEAAIGAIRDGKTRYTAPGGLLALRQTIARSLGDLYGRTLDPAGFVVSNGAKQALFNVCFTLFGPGDKVLVPIPYWTSYPPILRLARAESVEVKTEQSRDFRVTTAELEAAYDDRVRGLILNSPSNPSGAVYTLEEIEAIVRWAAERDVWVISDEIYSRICFNAPRAASVLDLDDSLLEKVVVIDGASKAFAMTGWRIGFSYTNRALAAKMTAVQSQMTSNVATPSQYAAIAAYGAEPLEAETIRSMSRTFQHRRDRLIALWNELLPDVPYIQPEGAFYLFFRADGLYDAEAPNSIAFCTRILERAGVAMVPGDAFGDDRFVRISYATSEAKMEDAVRRLASAIHATA